MFKTCTSDFLSLIFFLCRFLSVLANEANWLYKHCFSKLTSSPVLLYLLMFYLINNILFQSEICMFWKFNRLQMGVHFEFLCYFSQLLVIVFLLKISDDMLKSLLHLYMCVIVCFYVCV